jgi:hypothetical protein
MAEFAARHVRTPVLATVFGAASAAALVAALRLPAAVTLSGLACFGIVHNGLELRYVIGRFAHVLSGRFPRLLLVLITGIVLCRAYPLGVWSRESEILLGYTILGVAAVHALRARAWRLAGVAMMLAGAAACSLAFPEYHFVVLTHLHNLVPLLFLAEWSTQLPRGRATFLSAQLLWVLVIPALLLSGLLDRWLVEGPVSPAAGYTPPLWLGSAVAARFLAVFAFLQTMHYVVWVWFMPRHGPGATATFERRLPELRGARWWTLGLLGAAALGALFAADYAAGKVDDRHRRYRGWTIGHDADRSGRRPSDQRIVTLLHPRTVGFRGGHVVSASGYMITVAGARPLAGMGRRNGSIPAGGRNQGISASSMKMSQSCWCTTVWWWRHSRSRLRWSVSPPSAHSFRWWAWHQAGGRSHPGKAQPRSRSAR